MGSDVSHFNVSLIIIVAGHSHETVIINHVFKEKEKNCAEAESRTWVLSLNTQPSALPLGQVGAKKDLDYKYQPQTYNETGTSCLSGTYGD